MKEIIALHQQTLLSKGPPIICLLVTVKMPISFFKKTLHHRKCISI